MAELFDHSFNISSSLVTGRTAMPGIVKQLVAEGKLDQATADAIISGNTKKINKDVAIAITQHIYGNSGNAAAQAQTLLDNINRPPIKASKVNLQWIESNRSKIDLKYNNPAFSPDTESPGNPHLKGGGQLKVMRIKRKDRETAALLVARGNAGLLPDDEKIRLSAQDKKLHANRIKLYTEMLKDADVAKGLLDGTLNNGDVIARARGLDRDSRVRLKSQFEGVDRSTAYEVDLDLFRNGKPENMDELRVDGKPLTTRQVNAINEMTRPVRKHTLKDLQAIHPGISLADLRGYNKFLAKKDNNGIMSTKDALVRNAIRKFEANELAARWAKDRGPNVKESLANIQKADGTRPFATERIQRYTAAEKDLMPKLSQDMERRETNSVMTRYKAMIPDIQNIGTNRGYESYQYAKNISSTPREGYVRTYNRHGEVVYVPSGSLSTNLDDNVLSKILKADDGTEINHNIKFLTHENGLWNNNLSIERGGRAYSANITDALDKFVLTEYGARQVDKVNALKPALNQHLKVIEDLMTSIDDASRKNQRQHLQLTDTVKRAFGLFKEDGKTLIDDTTINTTQAYRSFGNYLMTNRAKLGDGQFERLSNIRLDPSRMSDSFDALRAGAFEARKERWDHWSRAEGKFWHENSQMVKDRIQDTNWDLGRLDAEDADFEKADMTDSGEIQRALRTKTASEELDLFFAEESKWTDISEEGRIAIEIEKSALQNIGRSDAVTMQKIMRAVGRTGVTGKEIELDQETYNRYLNEINTLRNAPDKDGVRLGKLSSINVVKLEREAANPEMVDSWRRALDRQDSQGLARRRKGDVVPYQIREVTDSGTVLAERLTVNPQDPNKKISVRMEFNDTKELLRSIMHSTNTHGLDDNRIQIDKELANALTKKHNAYVHRSGGNVLDMENIIASMSRKDVSPDSLFNEISGSNKVPLFDSGRVKINQGLRDIIASSAGWMLNSNIGEQEKLQQTAHLALMDTLNGSREIIVGTPEGYDAFKKPFDDETLKLFKKNLHKRYFEDNSIHEPTAAQNLVRSVSDYAKNYIDDDQELIAETKRLLGRGTEAGGIIANEASYYSPVFNDEFIRSTIEDRSAEAARNKNYDEKFSAVDKVQIDEDTLSEGELEEQRVNQGKSMRDSDLDRRNASITGISKIREGQINSSMKTLQNLMSQRNRLNSEEGLDNPKKLGTLEAFMEKGYFNKPGESVQSLQHLKDLRITDEMLVRAMIVRNAERYGRDQSLEIIDEMFNRASRGYSESGKAQGDKVLNISTLLNAKDQTREVTSKADLENLIKLQSESKGMKMSFDIAGEPTEMRLGSREGEVLARSLSRNITSVVEDLVRDVNGKRISKLTSWNGEFANNADELSLTGAIDGSQVRTPAGAFPLETNTDYSINSVTRHAGGGFLSSSVLGTKQAIEDFKLGDKAMAFDMETTGLLSSKRPELTLPVEMYGRDVEWEDGGINRGKANHIFFDVGSHVPEGHGGQSIEGLINNRFGGRTSAGFISDALGNRASVGSGIRDWTDLNASERREVVRDDRIGLMRNIAKYSPSATSEDKALFKNFDAAIDDIDGFMNKLYAHAPAGIDYIRNIGDSVKGAHVTDDLGKFVDAYNVMTQDKILMGHNLRDADVAWMEKFGKDTGRSVNTQPAIIEGLHLSRIVDGKEQSRHSLEEIVSRYAKDVPSIARREAQGGAHLANIDVENMIDAQEAQLDKLGDPNIRYLQDSDHLIKFTNRDGNQLSHDQYRIVSRATDSLQNPETGMFELEIQRADAINQDGIERISAPSLQELQRNVTHNFMAFDDADKAKSFMDDLTFDDARRNISEASLNYGDMVRQMSRYQEASKTGDFANLGGNPNLERLRHHYNAAQAGAAGKAISSMSDEEIKLFSHGSLFEDKAFDKATAVDPTDRQIRAGIETSGFFGSEDARRTLDFQSEVENLRAAGVIEDATTGKELIAQFNARIRKKAQEAGREPVMKSVPGLIDLGRLGRDFGPISNTHITAMANTYEQAEGSVWNISKTMEAAARSRQDEIGDVKQEAMRMTMRHLKSQGIIEDFDPDNPRVGLAADGLMRHAANNTAASVEDLRVPLIHGADDAAMIDIFESTKNELLDPLREGMSDGQMESYNRTKAFREQYRAAGMEVPNFDFGLGVTEAGVDSNPYTAQSLMSQINALGNGPDSQETRKAMWGAMLERATARTANEATYGPGFGNYWTDTFTDADEARGYLGWQSQDANGAWVSNSADNYIHPMGKNAGARYNELSDSQWKGVRDHHLERVATADVSHASNVVQERIKEYDDQLKDGAFIRQPAGRSVLQAESDDIARNAINRVSNEYVDSETFHAMGGAAQPNGWANQNIEAATENTRRAMAAALEHIKGNGVAYGLAAGGIAAAMMVRQWTRGDNIRPEERPGHDQSPSAGGTFDKKVSKPWDGQLQPMQQSTMVTQQGQGKGFDIRVSGRNPGGISNDAIGGALNQGAQGAAINVNHQDDTSSINSQWLQDKFSQLLNGGFAK